MSERKVLSKYYPPDFDPSKIVRTRASKNAGPKQMTVRLMAPFSMKCLTCGEYIYKGRKFNARKETTDEKYYAIPIYRFYIRCTRCSAEITFKTDPKNMDYTCEKGAKRNFEPWREKNAIEETEEERLDRLEREEEEKNAMAELEVKTLDAKREMAIADALDEIRTRNARIERGEGKEGVASVQDERDEERERQEREDEEAAKRAFAMQDIPEETTEAEETVTMEDVPKDEAPKAAAPSFKRVVKKKKDLSSALGIKKKVALV
ncbi:MAG: Pre-mRNA-splicing factor cwf16 [Caeruleum heppii]|nr:MAG: Pre-mRNA-splicing factor cwf16 [Caeruleum heppii]